MTLTSFGYASLRSDKIDDWADYGAKFLGLQLVERTQVGAEVPHGRPQAAHRRLVGGGAERRFGWEVEDAAALDALAGRLESGQGRRRARAGGRRGRLRGVREAIRFAGSRRQRAGGLPRRREADAPFVPGRPISGFRTGTLGMGHVVLHVKNVEDLRWFYQDVLGFRLSDYMLARSRRSSSISIRATTAWP